MTYGTVAQLKRELSIDSSDTSHDDYLDDLLAAAASWIETETGRTFSTEATTVTDEVYRNTRGTLFLKSIDIKSVTKVELKYLASDDYVELDTDEYDWQSTGQLMFFPNYWARSWSIATYNPSVIPYIRVSYTHGGDAVPAAIDRIAIETAANMYRGRGDNTTISSEQIGDYKVSYRDAAKAGSSMAETLKSYRIYHV